MVRPIGSDEAMPRRGRVSHAIALTNDRPHCTDQRQFRCTDPLAPAYSALRTTFGSSRDARHAGIQQAIAEVSASNATTLT